MKKNMWKFIIQALDTGSSPKIKDKNVFVRMQENRIDDVNSKY